MVLIAYVLLLVKCYDNKMVSLSGGVLFSGIIPVQGTNKKRHLVDFNWVVRYKVGFPNFKHFYLDIHLVSLR